MYGATCPKIERLYLRGKFDPQKIFQVDQAEPLETNIVSHLRDLR